MTDRFDSSDEMIRRAKESLRSAPSVPPPSAPPPSVPPRPAPEPAPHADRVEHLRLPDLEVPDPGGSGPTTQTAPRDPRRGLLVGIVAAIVLAAGIAFVVAIDPEPGPVPGEPLPAAPPVGTCLDDPGGGYFELIPTSCDGDHDLEVFALVDLPYGPDADLPTDDELFDEAFRLCEARFAGYTGESYDTSPYSILRYVPDALGWAAGDREVVCMLYLDDGAGGRIPWQGSARSST